MSVTEDRIFIKKAIRLAAYGAGHVSPNPMVGAIIVKNGRIIGSGYHRKYGGPHAEVNALESAAEPVAGATLYCNLEPCSHTNKQTPPCVPSIIRAGVRRVVVANIDPNPGVNGKGIAALRKAGVQVESGVEEEKGRELNRFFFKFITEKQPYVTIKYAQTIDGFIARSRDRQDWISGNLAQKRVHQLRARYDAVLIGGQTLRVDNPQLTVRQSRGRDPLRIILSSSLALDPSHAVFHHHEPGNTWIITTETAGREAMKRLAGLGCRIIPLKSGNTKRVAIGDLLHVLADQKIISLLVEGGREVISAFLHAGLVDELKIIQAPRLWGKGFRAFPDTFEPSTRMFTLQRTERMESDILLTYRSL
jgi:diaminohydroxyphosphoribosylaminopyrimidine deaminase/5-amino-6-(5-phosphoribosylamino)uracil reductase